MNVAHLPYDAGNYLETVEVSVHDVLRYSVVNLKDAAATLGKGNYRVKREADGARVCHTPNWRRGA